MNNKFETVILATIIVLFFAGLTALNVAMWVTFAENAKNLTQAGLIADIGGGVIFEGVLLFLLWAIFSD